jgi:pyridoxamine 5'-phosphate oxidase
MNNEYSTDPIEQLRAWLATEAVALATATATGAPSLRMVLLKAADERGLVFFTGYESRKAKELAENPRAAMLIHTAGRQVRVEGVVEPLEPGESDDYWETRPRGSQIAAWVSRQSEPIESREELDRRFAEFDAAHPEELGRPPHWGGYRLFAESYEFWEHRDDRLHDRIRYSRQGDGWTVERLQP